MCQLRLTFTSAKMKQTILTSLSHTFLFLLTFAVTLRSFAFNFEHSKGNV